MANHVLGCVQVYCGEVSKEKWGKEDDPDALLPQMPGVEEAKKLQGQSTGVLFGELGAHCFITRLHLSLIFFFFCIFYFFPICDDALLMKILNWCEWTKYQAPLGAKISSLPPGSLQFSKAIFVVLLNILCVLEHISRRAQRRVC